MEREFETQVPDINVKQIVARLRKLGAVEEPELLQKRWVFDIKPCNDKSQGEWIRLRQAGDKKPTITYKDKTGKGLTETKELEIEVSDFDMAYKILSKIQFAGTYYQENRRHKFKIDQIEFTIDSWPMIPPLLEIEGKSEADVAKGLEMLGLTGKDVGHVGMVNTYSRYGIDLHSYKKLTFES